MMTIGWPTVPIVELMFSLETGALHANDQTSQPKKRSGSQIPLHGVRNVTGQVMWVIIAFIVQRILTLNCFPR